MIITVDHEVYLILSKIKFANTDTATLKFEIWEKRRYLEEKTVLTTCARGVFFLFTFSIDEWNQHKSFQYR